MKKLMSKLLSFFLTLFFVFPSTAIRVTAEKPSDTTLTENTSASSSLLKPVEYSEEYKEYLRRKTEGTWPKGAIPPLPYELKPQAPKLGKRDTLPESYDPRLSGMVTPIKNQGNRNTCFVFGLIATLEHCMKRQLDIKYDLDLSEEQLLASYIARVNSEGGLPRYIGLQDYNTDFGFTIAAASHIISKECPKKEKDWTYDWLKNTVSDSNYIGDHTDYPQLKERCLTNLNLSDGKTQVDVKNIIVISGEVNSIKQAILDYGAVTYNYCSNDSYLGTDNISYYDNVSTTPNHGVCVVGWDDNYDRNKFDGSTSGLPTQNGAWLIKNSLGTNSGDDGYFWMSYESRSYGPFITFSGLTDLSVYNPNNGVHEEVYQHTTNSGFFNMFELDNAPKLADGSVKIASVFDFADDSRVLTAVTIENPNPSVNYKISYAPVENGIINLDKESDVIASGTLNQVGYLTIDLPDPVILNTGKNAIIMTLNCGQDQPIHINSIKFVPNPLESTISEPVHSGECYIIDASNNCIDLASDGALKLTMKAITQKSQLSINVFTETTNAAYYGNWTNKNVHIFVRDPDSTGYQPWYSTDNGQTWNSLQPLGSITIMGKNGDPNDVGGTVIQKDGITNIQFRYSKNGTMIPCGSCTVKIDTVTPNLDIKDETNRLKFQNLAENASTVNFYYNTDSADYTGEWTQASSSAIPKLEGTYYVKAVNEAGVSSEIKEVKVSKMGAAASLSEGGKIGLSVSTAIFGFLTIVATVAAVIFRISAKRPRPLDVSLSDHESVS